MNRLLKSYYSINGVIQLCVLVGHLVGQESENLKHHMINLEEIIEKNPRLIFQLQKWKWVMGCCYPLTNHNHSYLKQVNKPQLSKNGLRKWLVDHGHNSDILG